MAAALGAIGGGGGAAAGGASAGGGAMGALGGLMGAQGTGKGGGNSPFYDMGGLMREASQRGSDAMNNAVSASRGVAPTVSAPRQGGGMADALLEQLQSKIGQVGSPSGSAPAGQLQGQPNFMNPLNKPQMNLGNQASQLDDLRNYKFPL